MTWSSACEHVNHQKVIKPTAPLKLGALNIFDKDDFITDLKLWPWNSIEIYDDIDDSLAHWKELFMELYNSHCPVVCRRVRTCFFRWVDTEIREQIKLKHYYQREALNKNLQILRMMYKNFRNNVSNMLKAAK